MSNPRAPSFPAVPALKNNAMKKIYLGGLLLAAAVALLMCTSASDKASQLEVSFQYARQNTSGSNQYAVWIEDASGKFVKTLFVTKYTAKGRARGGETAVRGFIVRPACVPRWVKAAGAAEMTDEALDAVSGATPSADGLQSFVWDMTDQAGKAVPKGEYKVMVEATLFNDHAVLFSGTFRSDAAAGDVVLKAEYTQPDNNNFKNMVSDVKAVLK